jgi:hypothetical protein
MAGGQHAFFRLKEAVMWRNILLAGAAAAICAVATVWCIAAGETAPQVPASQAGQPEAMALDKSGTTANRKQATAVKPKPLSEHVKRGVKWLVEHQLKRGAWGQGEESAYMGGGMKMMDVPSVADTSVAALALVRAGNTPAHGEHAKSVLRAVEFICGQIEESDQHSLYVTPTRNTRVQQKLGPYIDTFAAAVLLPEIKDQMPDEAGKKRVAAALEKLLVKIQKNQRNDGTWGGEGWATTIQQNMGVKALNRAAQAGAPVDEVVRARAEDQARRSYDKKSGKFSPAGSAGVELYAASSSLSSMAESAKTNAQQTAGLEQTLASPGAAGYAKAAAHGKLARFKAAADDLHDAQAAVVARLNDKQFVSGFGSNGGEEFLSYLNIGESLVVQGGDAWKAWDAAMRENLTRVQNNDGSWSGHHCITGRTFCTAAALLVLMIDRAPQPIAEKMKRR